MSDDAQSIEPHAEGDSHGAAHVERGVSTKTYLTVFVALCILTTGSFLTYTDLWRTHFSAHTGWALMMAISCTKALLVILFFMHLKYEANWKYVLTIPAGFMSIFLTLMLVPDVGLRFWKNPCPYTIERLEFCAIPKEFDKYAKIESPHAPAAGAAAPQGK